MRSAVRNTILLVGLVAALGVAVWRFTSPKDDERPPDTAESTTDWICDICGKITTLTARKADEWRDDPQKTRYGKEFDAKQTVYYCDDCKKFSMVRARYCSAHKEWWYRKAADGSPGVCPGCAAEAAKP